MLKKQFEFILQFKLIWGLIFAAAILLYTIINMILGKTSMEFVVVWQFVLITMVLVFIHYLIFGEFILHHASTKLKLAVHFALCYATLLISGLAVKLINISKLNHYIIFTVGFVMIYLFITLSLYIYYKATGEELNKKLAVYKKNREAK